MSRVDYTGICNQIKTILEADSRTSDARVYVEEEPQIGLADNMQAVAIFMERRTPTAEQPLAAGKQTRYLLRISLWVVFFSMESFAKASEGRDTLLSNVELVMMANRTIGSKVTVSWLDGGEMLSARDAQSSVFVSAGEVVVVAEAKAINT